MYRAFGYDIVDAFGDFECMTRSAESVEGFWLHHSSHYMKPFRQHFLGLVRSMFLSLVLTPQFPPLARSLLLHHVALSTLVT